MATQRQELVTKEFNFTATTFEEAKDYATYVANSGLCPENYKGRPNDILIVWQTGAEIGLGKMQSLRILGCVNGTPFAFGDGLLALAKGHPKFTNMEEWTEGVFPNDEYTAFCKMIRKDNEPIVQKFSIADAKRAGLWNKKGTWQQYPKRMLQHRARCFAARDAFPDALFGLRSEYEAREIHEQETVRVVPAHQSRGVAGLEQTLGINEPQIIEGEIIEAKSKLDELKELIERHDVTKGAVTITLKKFGVEALEALSDEQIDRWSNHLKSKERK